jgi:hypothetical protein
LAQYGLSKQFRENVPLDDYKLEVPVQIMFKGAQAEIVRAIGAVRAKLAYKQSKPLKTLIVCYKCIAKLCGMEKAISAACTQLDTQVHLHAQGQGAPCSSLLYSGYSIALHVLVTIERARANSGIDLLLENVYSVWANALVRLYGQLRARGEVMVNSPIYCAFATPEEANRASAVVLTHSKLLVETTLATRREIAASAPAASAPAVGAIDGNVLTTRVLGVLLALTFRLHCTHGAPGNAAVYARNACAAIHEYRRHGAGQQLGAIAQSLADCKDTLEHASIDPNARSDLMCTIGTVLAFLAGSGPLAEAAPAARC